MDTFYFSICFTKGLSRNKHNNNNKKAASRDLINCVYGNKEQF